MSDEQVLAVNHEATNAFIRLADAAWLHFTDDSPVPDAADPEVFFRLGFLLGLQLVGGDLEGDPEVLAALPVTGAAMEHALGMRDG